MPVTLTSSCQMHRSAARSCRGFLVAVVASATFASCFLSPVDLSGKACDPTHACTMGWKCVNGICVIGTESDANSSKDSGETRDSGPGDSGVSDAGCTAGCAGNAFGSACVNGACGCNSENDCQPQQACNLTIQQCSQACLSDGGIFSLCLGGCCGPVTAICKPGDSSTSCGSSGKCVDCKNASAGQVCVGSDAGYSCGCLLPTDCAVGLSCDSSSVCTPNCDAQHPCNGGCCAAGTLNSICQPGNVPVACGASGGICQNCGNGTCNAGACSACSMTCVGGCCSGSTCTSPPTLQNCGLSGVACTACDPRTADNCNMGMCQCGSKPQCSLGQYCDGGCIAIDAGMPDSGTIDAGSCAGIGSPCICGLAPCPSSACCSGQCGDGGLCCAPSGATCPCGGCTGQTGACPCASCCSGTCGAGKCS
jgi:hypothetical protein